MSDMLGLLQKSGVLFTPEEWDVSSIGVALNNALGRSYVPCCQMVLCPLNSVLIRLGATHGTPPECGMLGPSVL